MVGGLACVSVSARARQGSRGFVDINGEVLRGLDHSPHTFSSGWTRITYTNHSSMCKRVSLSDSLIRKRDN